MSKKRLILSNHFCQRISSIDNCKTSIVEYLSISIKWMALRCSKICQKAANIFWTVPECFCLTKYLL